MNAVSDRSLNTNVDGTRSSASTTNVKIIVATTPAAKPVASVVSPRRARLRRPMNSPTVAALSGL